MASKNAASESSVGMLHSRITSVLNRTLEMYDLRMQAYEQALAAYQAATPEDRLEMEIPIITDPSPALLTVANNFVKNNGVTCQVEENTEMSDLQKRLKEKKTKRLASVSPIQATN